MSDPQYFENLNPYDLEEIHKKSQNFKNSEIFLTFSYDPKRTTLINFSFDKKEDKVEEKDVDLECSQE